MDKTYLTIGLTEDDLRWLERQIESRRYVDIHEYFQRLICADREKSAELEAISAALTEGEESGRSRPFDPEAFLRRMVAGNG